MCRKLIFCFFVLLSIVSDTAMICQTFNQSTRHTAYDSHNGHLSECTTPLVAPDQVQLMWSAVLTHVSLSIAGHAIR